jgi:hypothetical protein
MKFLVSLCFIAFILLSCGKKSKPEYQGKLNQIKIII